MASRPIQHLQSVASVPKPEPQEPLNLAPIEHGKFRLSTTGLTVVGEPTYEEWEEVGHVLAVMVHGLPFIIGDWIRCGETRFGEMAYQAISAREWSPSTVRTYVWLSEKVPEANRMIDRGLSVKHHIAVAALPVVAQRVWLSRALGNGDGEQWTVNRLTNALRAGDDLPVTGYYLMVGCSSERQRSKIAKMAELEGGTVKLIDKRERKGEK